ncbi:MAG: glycine--tRNA ligase subunit beta [Bacillota bacterium]|nr:glycine--tRNA ligase subunit beta [Bacillota bacterium]
MKRDLLLELGVEEMPSSFMGKSLEDLKNLAEQKFSEKRFEFDQVKTLGTPRRIVLHVEGLAEKQADALIENRGPKKAAAFDAEGNPTRAAQGFARGQGIDVADLVIKEVGGVEHVFAIKKEIGGKTEEILPELLLEMIHSLGFPKSMRWGYHHLRFARPIRWILAMYGEQSLTLQVENVVSGNVTYGHRFLSPGEKTVSNITGYFKTLKDSYVIVDQEERKALIWKQIQDVAHAQGGHVMENEDLLDEITYLLEYPTAFYGEFSSSYLDVPPEVLTTSMIENQRYFPLFDDADNLMAGFIGVRNGTDYRIDLVKAGNERVLKARLEDALFFWKEDTRKPLSELVPGLKNVLFHERLGSIYAKVERLQKLAVYIGETYQLSDAETVYRAATLCKADLLSSMVYEFTELQGIMGRYYAYKSEERVEVAEAVFEHYLPRFAGDQLPQTEAGMAVALAEKMDNLVACFSIGIKPTGSQDPYALRRQALGIVNIVLESDLTIDLASLISQAYQGLTDVRLDLSQEETVTELIDFIKGRMRGLMLERGFSYDVVDAVIKLPVSDMNDIVCRAEVIRDFKEVSYKEDFMVVFNRSNNLSKKWDSTVVNELILEDESEKVLYHNLKQMQDKVNQAIQERSYEQAIESLAGLRPALDIFFDAVMVMVEDEHLKAARLGILKQIAVLCNGIADFAKVLV